MFVIMVDGMACGHKLTIIPSVDFKDEIMRGPIWSK